MGWTTLFFTWIEPITPIKRKGSSFIFKGMLKYLKENKVFSPIYNPGVSLCRPCVKVHKPISCFGRTVGHIVEVLVP